MPLLKKWRELLLSAVLIIIIILLSMLIKNLFSLQKEAIQKRDITKNTYNKILTGETSEEKLNMMLAQIKEEYRATEECVPKELKKQDVISALMDISENVNIKGLEIKDMILTSEPPKKGEKYETIKVNIKSFSGTYENIKQFLEYIKNYNREITINNLNFTREKDSKEFKGSMTLCFYGDINS
jgi:Tfp pilus assembly protein PilO